MVSQFATATKTKIALFGGAFDPPHLGHAAIATYLLDRKIVDEVWWVPTGQHPFQKNMSAAYHRVAMLQLILGPKQRVERWEVEQQLPSYTVRTLEHFRTAQPDHTFYWVIGSDNLAEFDSWHGASEILAHHQVVVYPRQGFPLPTEPAPGFILLEQAPLVTVASTQVRELVQGGGSISGLVDWRVAHYIKQEQLYAK